MNIAILITCHNRKGITYRCLDRLLRQLDGGSKVFLVDDGSVDGTGDMVREKFPDVRVSESDGTLYWAKGMRKAWESALEERRDWDGYLWLNDDSELHLNAMTKILTANDGERIVVGDFENSEGKIVYGMREGGLFTGNCLFIPRKAFMRLGLICGDYSHAWADYDYALQAKRIGVQVVSAGVVGKVEDHPNRPSLKGVCLKSRWQLLFDPKGWNLHDLWLYRRRNWGTARAMLSCFHLVLYVVCGRR